MTHPDQFPSSAVPVSGGGFNLLAWRPVAALIRGRGFPGVLRAVVLAAFLALAVIGWAHHTPPGINAKLYAKANLVNLLIWGLWWPAIVWVTFLLGRVWCMVCPLELVSSQAEKLGRRLGLIQRPLGSWLAQGSLGLLLFALLQMLVPGVQIHRVPHYTSLFLWTSLGLAMGAGLLFKDRAFCRGFCPVGLLLNAYGRGGMLAVRPAGSKRAGAGSGAPDSRSCRSLLNPARLNTSKDCLMCGDCLKADRAGTMALVLRAPYAAADARERMASWPLTLFVVLVSGFVTYELCGVWKPAEAVFLWVPRQVSSAVHAGAMGGWIQGVWTIVAVPLLLWLILGGSSLLLGGARSLGEAWRRLALPIAVVVATGHMAKSLEKFTSWAGFLPYAWAEPSGVQTALRMHGKTLAQPAPWLSPEALSVASLLLLAAGTLLGVREARLANPEAGYRRFAPVFLLGGFYAFLVFGWGGWLN